MGSVVCFSDKYLFFRKQETKDMRRVENERAAALRVRAVFSQSGSVAANCLLIEAS